MLFATQAKSIAGTSKYFDSVLMRGDYYTGTEINGTWQGKAAEMLGLEQGSEVSKGQFKALLSGLHPITGKKLAQRIRKDRRPGVDLTYSCPKSVSAIWAINKDERILDVLQETVRESLELDVEPLVCRRVRDGKAHQTKSRKKTGNLIAADFLHKTARPVENRVDMHLHVHAFVMNHTSDGSKHYAAELEEIFRERPSIQAKFEARLARRLHQDLNYEVEKTRFKQSNRWKNGWEIKGLSRETIEKFSSRTGQVEEAAQELGIEKASNKGKLGVKTRDNKDSTASVDELREEWESRLTPVERKAFQDIQTRMEQGQQEQSETSRIEKSVRYALDHHLFRQSTVERHQVVATALEHGLTLAPEDVEAALDSEEILHRAQGVRGVDRHFITTKEVLAAEEKMIAFAKEGRGTRSAIGRKEHVFKREWLNKQQKAAVNHVLKSRDTLSIVMGRAGVGKTSLMEEAAEAIKSNGKDLFVFGPSTGSREALVENGFAEAQTVEHLVRNEKLHPSLKDQVIWIDEAGLLDVRTMNRVIDIAQEQNCRIVLSGDTRQHNSPTRGDAARLIETEAGIQIARVEEIQRQKGRYRRAVELISKGNEIVDAKTGLTGMLAGFDMMDRLGKIKEIDPSKRHEVVAKRYLKARKRKRETLVVAPTHKERHAITSRIREGLRDAGAIGCDEEETVRCLRSCNLSHAEKSEAMNFDAESMVVQFHQNVKGGFKRGERYNVVSNTKGGKALQPVKGGNLKEIPHQAADRFEVYTEEKVGFALGDKVRLTLGGKSTEGKRLANGRMDEIKGFDRDGNLKLKSGVKLSRDYGHLDLGYVITSHASQGSQAALTICAIGSESLVAVHAKQFYVSTSRGRENCVVYVDDKVAVRRAIQETGDQQSATELMRSQETQRALIHQSQAFFARVRRWWQSRERSKAQSQSQPFAATSPASGFIKPTLGRT